MRVCRFLLALICVAGRVLSAQATTEATQGAVLRGTVTSRETGQPLQFALVSIPSLDRQQFANSQGKFYFAGVRPGTYRLTVRQLGYTASALDLTVVGGQDQDVVIGLQRIVTKLASRQVLADWTCDNPGRPNAAGRPELREVFEQLEQNAVRMRLMSTAYPFDVITERVRILRYRTGPESIEGRDTVRSVNQQTARYRPGEVVQTRELKAKRPEKHLVLPTLLDFADSLFQANHCFLLRGVDETATGKEIRVDFKPYEKLTSPDVAGSVFLESETYKLLRSDIQMTKIPREFSGLARVTALTYFDDLVVGLPVAGEVVAISDLKPNFTSLFGLASQSVERLITLKVLFHNERPDSVPPP